MKAERKSILRGVVISGMIAGAMPVMANSSDLFNYQHMGSGSELRAELFEQYGSPIDLQSASTVDYFVGEAKCGEATCGEGKKEAKKETKKTSTEGKTSEAKCGEAKCGEKSKKEAKKETKEKTSEAKCGENTCGGK